MDKYEETRNILRLSFPFPVLQAGNDSFTAFAILAIAIGLAGLAILILFAKKKI